MGKKYTHITEYERIQIEALITAGQSIKEIAEQLNKNYSTIWRELQRGKYIQEIAIGQKKSDIVRILHKIAAKKIKKSMEKD